MSALVPAPAAPPSASVPPAPGTPGASYAPPRDAPRDVPHNVPQALSSFVGRAREREALAAALAGARLVTVTGPGGTGKTRLAREVAAAFAARTGGDARADAPNGSPDEAANEAAPAAVDGVWWVELAPVDAAAGDPDATTTAVAAAVAGVLGVRLAADRPPAAALADAVGARALLLVLDNCEHVVDAAAGLADALLRACPHLTVLATSREALAVEGEVASVLPPLARPPRRAELSTATADAVGAYEAVQLFVDRARAARPAFTLTDRNAPAVAAVCARLDGIPLALELAAAHVATLGVEALARRLDDALGLLTRGRRTAPPRQQTLRALLDWSYDRLAPAERRLLRRLAVFRDAATLDAVAAVCGPDGASDVFASLARLVEQSLVDVRDARDTREAGGAPAGGEVRYALLETVRQYGAERLAADPDDERALRDRHLAWAAGLVQEADARLWSGAWTAEAARLTAVVDDLRAAVAWAAQAADPSPAGRARAADALRVVGPLMWYWVIAGGWEDATHVAGAALGAAVSAGLARREEEPARWTPAPDAPPAARRALGVALACWTVLRSLRNQHADALPAIAGALALWDAECAGDAPDLVALRWRSYTGVVAAEAHLATGDAAEAVRLGAGVVADARASGDPRAVAFALTRSAFVLAAVGRPAPAAAMLEEAVPLWEAERDVFFLALAQQTRAELALAAGDAPAAARYARASVALPGEDVVPFLLARSLVLAAATALAAGRNAPNAIAAPTTAAAAAGSNASAAEAAARLLGAAERLRTRSGTLLQHYDRPVHDGAVAAATAALGPEPFRAAWAAGERLTPREAVALALSASLAPAADTPAVEATSAATAAAAPLAAVPAEAARGDAAPGEASAARTPAAVASAADVSAPEVPVLEAPAAPALRVEALGPLVVRRGVGADESPVVGKVAELLVYLLAHPEGRTKEQIGLALWPDASAAQVRSSFHFTLHHLRRALGTLGGRGAGGVAFAEGRYRLAGVASDLGDLLAAAARLRRAEAERAALDDAALDAAERALGAPRGPLGEGLAAGEWVAAPERAAAEAWAEGVQALARQHARAGRHARAAAVLEPLVRRDPLREGAAREFMVLLAAAGERGRALAHYDALAAALAREVGAAPARETRAVAEAIRRA